MKMTDKHKIMAYVLSTDADLNRIKIITQKDIANLFGVSQATISQAVKETKYRLKITSLEKELIQAKAELKQLSGIETLQIPEDIDKEYKRMP